MPVPLNIPIYQRGNGGIPSSSQIGVDLAERADSYTHTITDRFGFESMQVAFKTSLDDAIDWLLNGLMRSTVVTDLDGRVVWEGLASTITVQIGQKPVTLSLDPLANRVRCKYTTVLGTPGTTATVSDTTSQALYGIKDRVVTLNSDIAAAAANKAAVVLADLAFPKSKQATQAMTGQQNDIQVTLAFVGWYQTLEWVVFARASTSNTAISTQIGALIGTVSPGIGAINNFLSTVTSRMITLSNTATEYVAADTTYREKLEALLGQGDGANPVTWGVYEDREFYIVAWAGATPATITYQERLGDSNVYDSVGGIVAPWLVRPNAISQVVELLDVASITTAPDAAGRKYVGRVTCSIQGDQIGCTLEPSETDSIDVRLAALR
jgi:hypothetical protein